MVLTNAEIEYAVRVITAYKGADPIVWRSTYNDHVPLSVLVQSVRDEQNDPTLYRNTAYDLWVILGSSVYDAVRTKLENQGFSAGAADSSARMERQANYANAPGGRKPPPLYD